MRCLVLLTIMHGDPARGVLVFEIFVEQAWLL
jgi:hypothetical protein